MNVAQKEIGLSTYLKRTRDDVDQTLAFHCDGVDVGDGCC
jgi:hypothetical protein